MTEEYTLAKVRRENYDLYLFIMELLQQERDACATLAEGSGLGEPYTLPPYSVRETIARAIRNRGCDDWI
jgi:hypothetical protein